jgi:hypothetical protein
VERGVGGGEGVGEGEQIDCLRATCCFCCGFECEGECFCSGERGENGARTLEES